MDFGGVVSMVCSQSLVLSYLGNLTWPALRMGSELFLGVVMVRLAAVLENWPRLIKLHDSSSLRVETQYLLLAEGCTVGSGGSEQLRRALLWGLHFKTQSRFFSLALDVKFGSHTFLVALFFVACSSFHHHSSWRKQFGFLTWYVENVCDLKSKKLPYNVSRREWEKKPVLFDDFWFH